MEPRKAQADGLDEDRTCGEAPCGYRVWCRFGNRCARSGAARGSWAMIGTMQSAKRTAVSAGCSLVALVLLTGCSDYRDGARPSRVAASVPAHCASSDSELPTGDDWGRMVGPGQVPDDFHAISVIHCTWDGSYLDDAGHRSTITMQEKRALSVPPALSASLKLPDQEFARFSNMACSAVGRAPQYLILVDASGRAVMPWLPQTPCGDAREEVAEALAGTRWTGRASYEFESTRI